MNAAKQQGIRTRENILNAIIQYMMLHGYSPSYTDIMKATGIKSKSTLHFQIKRMLDEGILESDHDGGEPRTLRVPGYRFVAKE